MPCDCGGPSCVDGAGLVALSGRFSEVDAGLVRMQPRATDILCHRIYLKLSFLSSPRYVLYLELTSPLGSINTYYTSYH